MIEENKNDWKQETTPNSSRGSRAKLGFMLTGLGVGGALAYLISRSARQGRERTLSRDVARRSLSENAVDDQGTTQEEAVLILVNLRNRGFESSDEKLAVALGRTPGEIQEFCSGLEVIDDDVIMKARGIALHRGIRLD